MKKLTKFILKKYQQMSGEQKIILGMNLSKAVREVRKAGVKTTGKY